MLMIDGIGVINATPLTPYNGLQVNR